MTVYEAHLDQCQYGLKPPSALPPEFVRKGTTIWSNTPAVDTLTRRCPGTTAEHVHVHALGTAESGIPGHPRVNRATAAGVYPSSLCQALAAAAMAGFNNNKSSGCAPSSDTPPGARKDRHFGAAALGWTGQQGPFGER